MTWAGSPDRSLDLAALNSSLVEGEGRALACTDASSGVSFSLARVMHPHRAKLVLHAHKILRHAEEGLLEDQKVSENGDSTLQGQGP